MVFGELLLKSSHFVQYPLDIQGSVGALKCNHKATDIGNISSNCCSTNEILGGGVEFGSVGRSPHSWSRDVCCGLTGDIFANSQIEFLKASESGSLQVIHFVCYANTQLILTSATQHRSSVTQFI